MTVTVAALCGSLRRFSYNRKLLDMAREMAPPGVRIVDVPIGALPHFNEDDEAVNPPAVTAFKSALHQADAILIATPEYNGAIPGVLKNALDWASRPYGSSPLTGKSVGVCGATPGPGGTRTAQEQLRKLLAVCMAEATVADVSVSNTPDSGELDSEVQAQVSKVLAELVTSVTGKLSKVSTPAQ